MTALTSTGMTTWVPQAEHDQALADLTAARAALTATVAALRLIGRNGCERYAGGQFTCRTTGKIRGAWYAADAWCDSCVAADALDGIPDPGMTTTIGSTE